MKQIYITALLLLTGLTFLGLSSCRFACVHGSGHQVSETRKPGDFSELSIAGGYDVVLKQDSTMSVKIMADDNLLKYIKTEVTGNRLKVFTKKNICSSGKIILTIGIGNLEELKATGGIEVTADGKINAHDLKIILAGATKITLDINAASIAAKGSGATELNLKGKGSSLDVDMSGSGKVNALDFVVNNCSIQTSGVGHCEVNVLNTLNIHSSGASEVKYRGNPNINNDKSGASSVEKVN